MDLQKIGQKLVELRGTKSREQVAVDLGISYSAVVSYELGEEDPSGRNQNKNRQILWRRRRRVIFFVVNSTNCGIMERGD